MTLERQPYLNLPLIQNDQGKYILKRKKLVINAISHLERIREELATVVAYLDVLKRDLPFAAENVEYDECDEDCE